jgi:hypothetical protein
MISDGEAFINKKILKKKLKINEEIKYCRRIFGLYFGL